MSQKAIFLDRDDTVIDDPGYLNEPEQIELLPGAAEALNQFKRMGYLVVIITNQSAIARGYMSEEKLEEIHQKLKNVLSAAGASIDGIYYCPYHPEGTVEEFARESLLRKPNPGMLHKAAEEMDIDLSRSWMIGDRYRDIEAGKAAGCHTILVDVPGKTRETTVIGPAPDRKAVNLREAVNIIRMYEFHQKAQAAKKAAEEKTPHEEPSPVSEPSTDNKVPESHAAEPERKEIADIDEPSRPAQDEIPEAIRQNPTEVVIAEEKEVSSPLKFHTARAIPKNEPQPEVEQPAERTQHLLQEVLQRLKSSDRTKFDGDFSVHKLLAGMTQVLALGCMIFSLWFWLSPEDETEKVQFMIGYAIALQLLVISLLMMHRRD